MGIIFRRGQTCPAPEGAGWVALGVCGGGGVFSYIVSALHLQFLNRRGCSLDIVRILVRTIAILSLLLLSESMLFAQYSSIGKEFYVGFIQNRTLYDGSASNGSGNLVRTALYVSNHSFEDLATVQVRYNGPAGAMEYTVDGVPQAAPGGVLEITVDPLDGHMVEMIPASGFTAADMQVMGNGKVGGNTFRVNSDEPIALYAQSWQIMSRDVSLVLPASSLGNDYVVMTAEPTPTRSSRHGGPAEFAIVAVEDNTVVRFQLDDDMSTEVGPLPRETITAGMKEVRLNAGETYQVQTDDYDLSGLRVWSDSCRPFALFSGNMAVKITDSAGSAWDHVYEQMFPVRSWGLSYATVPMTDEAWDMLKITAAEEGTTITIDGTLLMTDSGPLTLGRGDVLRIAETTTASTGDVVINGPTKLEGPSMVVGSGPIMIAGFGLSADLDSTRNTLDPFMIILSPIEQQIGSITFASLPATRRYLSVITHETNSGKVLIGDESGISAPISSLATWDPVGPSEYVHAKIDLVAEFGASITYRLTVLGDDPLGFNAYITGYNQLEGYGYAAGVNLDPLQGRRMIDEVICEGEEVVLNAAEGDAWRWEDDPTLDCTDCQRPTATPGVGVTQYRVAIERGCVTIYDTVEVDTRALPTIELVSDTLTCDVEPVRLVKEITGARRVSWSPARDLSCTDCPDPVASPSITTTYTVTVENPIGCTIIDSIEVVVLPIPVPTPGEDATICAGDIVQIGDPTIDTTGLTFRWTPSAGLDCDDCPAPIARPEETTTYSLLVTRDSICSAIDSVVVTVIDSTLLTVFIDDRHSGGSDEVVEIPVEVIELTGNRLIEELTFTLRYDPNVVVIDPFSLFPNRDRTLLHDWEARVIARDVGTFTVKFTTPRFGVSNARPLTTVGTLILFDAQIYLGSITQSDLEVEVTIPTTCSRVDTIPGRIQLDTICAVVHRLIEVGFTKFAPPQITPNPIHDQGQITFSLPFEGPARLDLIDARGRIVTTLLEGRVTPGTHQITFNRDAIPSGSYVVRLEWAGISRVVRLLIP